MRPGAFTFLKDGINYDKDACDPRIKSFWVDGVREGGGELVRPNGDIRRICGPAAGHVPALCNPTVQATLGAGPGPFSGAYADCTFGRGGHSAALLSRLAPDGRLYGFDVDPSAVAVGKLLEQRDTRFRMLHRRFGELADAIPAEEELSGVMMDLGFSSPQIDQRHRGMSSMHDAPLDLRYNPTRGVPAAEWLASLSAPELAWVIRQHGEDEDIMLGARIGESIYQWQREHGAFSMTTQLGDLISRAKRGMDDRGVHPAKLSFQSIRTWMNQEFFELEKVLEAAFQRLRFGGRCAVICFKRQETMALTRFASAHEEPDSRLVEGWPVERILELYPLLKTDKAFSVHVIGNPIAPTEQEMQYNIRCRSARTHVLEKRRRQAKWGIPAGHIPAQLFRKPARAPAFGGACAAPEQPDPPPDFHPDLLYCRYIGLPPAPSLMKVQPASLTNGEAAAPPVAEPPPRVMGGSDLAAWLLQLDGGGGALLVYREALEADFASLHELMACYGRDSGFDVARFCSDHGVRKAAHRRYVQRWASQACR